MNRNVALTAVLILSAVTFANVRQTAAVDYRVVGSKLFIKKSNGKAKFLWISKDPSITNFFLYPQNGATLTIASGDGDVRAVTIENWSDYVGVAKYKNKLAPGGDSVCQMGIIKASDGAKPGIIKIKCRDDLIDVLDGGPEGSVDVRLDMSQVRYCARFDAPTKDEPGVFTAKDSAPPSACTGATVPPKRVFVGSIPLTGNLGGLSGADSYCAARASAAGLTGTYKAWLGDHANDPVTRFTHYPGPYVRLDNSLIANSWLDMTDLDGHMPGGIMLNEFGVNVGSQDVWEGTSPNGERDGHNCVDWLSSNQNDGGSIGDTTSGLLGNPFSLDWPCDTLRYIYCFEQ